MENIIDYLKTQQPLIWRLFKNEKLANYFSHAYLLVGDRSTPLLETAKLLVKTILCKYSVDSCCDKCETCLKIDNSNFLSLKIVDGSLGTIKKEDIQIIEETFSKSSLEKSNQFFYIIHLAENMTQESTNSLLKFLEEPKENVTAILTTENISKVLPTIISRSQIVRFIPTNIEYRFSKLVEDGIDEKKAGILSFFSNNGEDANKILKDRKLWKEFTDIEQYISLLSLNKKEAYFFVEKTLFAYITDKESLRLVVDLISIYLSEAVKYHFLRTTALKTNEILLENVYNSIRNIDTALFEIYNARNEISININPSLLLLHINKLLTEE